VRDYLVSVQRMIPAAADQLFDLVAQPAMHPAIDGGESVRKAWPSNPVRLSLGATFSMDMQTVLPYRIRNTVVEFEEGRRIAWRHFYGHRWRYLFEARGAETLVTEQWDARTAKSRLPLVLLGFPTRNRDAMIASLERLEQLARAAA